VSFVSYNKEMLVFRNYYKVNIYNFLSLPSLMYLLTYNHFNVLIPHIIKVETPNTVLPTGKMSQLYIALSAESQSNATFRG